MCAGRWRKLKSLSRFPNLSSPDEYDAAHYSAATSLTWRGAPGCQQCFGTLTTPLLCIILHITPPLCVSQDGSITLNSSVALIMVQHAEYTKMCWCGWSWSDPTLQLSRCVDQVSTVASSSRLAPCWCHLAVQQMPDCTIVRYWWPDSWL